MQLRAISLRRCCGSGAEVDVGSEENASAANRQLQSSSQAQAAGATLLEQGNLLANVYQVAFPLSLPLTPPSLPKPGDQDERFSRSKVHLLRIAAVGRFFCLSV